MYIPGVFIATTILAIYMFYRATHKNTKVLLVLIGWLVIQAAIAVSGMLTVTGGTPPRFVILIAPPLLLVLALFLTARGKRFIDNLELGTLTLFHSVRIPVEMVLFWLFLHKLMPQLMTFEGRNMDIISGITAPVVFYFAFVARKMGSLALLSWNIVCLGILVFTVANGILSVPSNFQQFAFDQPNRALMYFPFLWLAGTIVPLAYFAHLVAIRRLFKLVKSKGSFTTLPAIE